MPIIDTIKQVATAIAKAGIGEESFGNFKNAFSGLSNQEIINATARNKMANASKALISAAASGENAAGVANALKIADVGDDAAAAVSKEITILSGSKQGLDTIIKRASEIASDGDSFGLGEDMLKDFGALGDKYQSYLKAANKGSKQRDAAVAELLGRTGKSGAGLDAITSGFFGDPKYGKARMYGVGGIYAGGALGARVLSGGDLTHNARGENDIAGVPFF